MTNYRFYRVLGTTDTAEGCDCCGRTNLKVYVGMEPREGGPVQFFGTGCAAKMEQVTEKQIRDEAKAADTAKRDADRAAKAEAAAAEEAEFLAWVADTYGVTASQPADLWDAVPGMTPFSLRLAFRG